jgi:hypothetical protein
VTVSEPYGTVPSPLAWNLHWPLTSDSESKALIETLPLPVPVIVKKKLLDGIP